MRLFLFSARQWHWISSALACLGMLFFSITGITLNHATQLESPPSIVTQQKALPEALINTLKTVAGEDTLPPELLHWLAADLKVSWSDQATLEWQETTLFLFIPGWKKESTVRVELDSGTAEHEETHQGWVSFLNDRHTNRHASEAWGWFIDIFAATCIVFCISGFVLLKRLAGGRWIIWPLLGFSLSTPLILAIFFLH